MTIEQLGRPQTSKTKKLISEKMKGKKNPAYKDGRRSARRIAGVKPNDGSIIHHKNGDSTDNRKSNLQKIPKNKRGEHDKMHKRGKNFKKSGGTKKVKQGYKAKELKGRKK